MKNTFAVVAGAAAGALLMCYLDAADGRRRRAMARDKLVAAGRDAADIARRRARHLRDRARGMVSARSMDGRTKRPPESAEQLRERIRSQLGRLVSHPGAVHVEAEREGHVRLSGHVLASEVEHLLDQVRHMPGVETVQNALAVHESAGNIPELQGQHVQAGPA